MKKLFIFALLLFIATGAFAQTVVIAVDYSPSVYATILKGERETGVMSYMYESPFGFEVKGTYLKNIGKMGIGVQVSGNLGIMPRASYDFKNSDQSTTREYLSADGYTPYTSNFNGLFVFAPINSESAIFSVGLGMNWLTHFLDYYDGDHRHTKFTYVTGFGIVAAVDINLFFTKHIGLNVGFEAAAEFAMFDDGGNQLDNADYVYAAMSFGLALRF